MTLAAMGVVAGSLGGRISGKTRHPSVRVESPINVPDWPGSDSRQQQAGRPFATHSCPPALDRQWLLCAFNQTSDSGQGEIPALDETLAGFWNLRKKFPLPAAKNQVSRKTF